MQSYEIAHTNRSERKDTRYSEASKHGCGCRAYRDVFTATFFLFVSVVIRRFNTGDEKGVPQFNYGVSSYEKNG